MWKKLHPRKLLTRFLAWRIKRISHKQFVLILSVLVGLASGLAAVVIKNSVALIQELLTEGAVENFHSYLYFAFPLVGILVTITLIRYVIRQTIYPGIPASLYSISKRQSVMERHNTWSSIITSAFTVGFGGSAGLEGPTVATSAAIGSNIGQTMRMNYQTKTLLIGCAAAGSLAAIFKAPIAAIIFAIEVIMLDLTLSSLVPLLLASITAVITSTMFLGEDTLFHYSLSYKIQLSDVPLFILLGAFTGIVSLGFTKVHNFTSGLIEKVQHPYRKAIIGGLVLGLILFVFPPLYGEGYEVVNTLIEGKTAGVFESELFRFFDKENIFIILAFLAILVLFKAVSTTITLSIGGIGGIFAPTLFMGSILGYLFAKIIKLFEWTKVGDSNFSLLGMAGLMAGILHAPLTAIFLIAEITGGYELFVPLMITAALSYMTIKLFAKHSIYTVQLARRGELITHDKDKAVLTLMSLAEEIETDLKMMEPGQNLGEMVKIVAESNRNIFPVLDETGQLVGVVQLNDIRKIMFDKDQYETTFVYDVMSDPVGVIDKTSNMDVVMDTFEATGAWNLPVVDQDKYVGFVSKSKLFSAYRKMLREFSGE